MTLTLQETEAKEQSAIAAFPETAVALAVRAQQEGLELVFHIFADSTDNFVTSPQEALSLYQRLRTEGYHNRRLWYELYSDHINDVMEEENHLIGYGEYPQ